MRAEKLWDGLAVNWDKPGVELAESDIRLIEKTRKYFNRSSTVLDYGCATGSVVCEIARTTRDVYGLDISSSMIKKAKTKALVNDRTNANFIQGTIFDEELKKESFDLITAFNILHLVPDLPRVLGRVNQLLKPGGMFVSASPCLGEKKVLGVMMMVPVRLLSKTGAIPWVSFFSAYGLTDSIAKSNFQIIANSYLNHKTIADYFIAAKKM